MSFVRRVESEVGQQGCIAWVTSDNGGVYRSQAMAEFCRQKGIQQVFSTPYAQWQNGVAERNMRTIHEMVLTTLIHANMPRRAWGWAALLACEVINRNAESVVSNRRVGSPDAWTRLERWYGRPLPNQVAALYPFGCLCFKHVPAELRNKMQMHASPMVYLGVDSDTRSYLLGSLYELHTTTAVEVTFLEDVFPFRKLQSQESPVSLLWGSDPQVGDVRVGMFPSGLLDGQLRDDFATLAELPRLSPAAPPDSEQVPLSRSMQSSEPPAEAKGPVVATQEPSRLEAAPAAATEAPTLRRSARAVKTRAMNTNNYRDFDAPDAVLLLNPGDDEASEEFVLHMVTEADLDSVTPRNAYEALRSPLKQQWLAAMNREKRCHAKNETFGHAAELNAEAYSCGLGI
jgi:hypothetical protein